MLVAWMTATLPVTVRAEGEDDSLWNRPSYARKIDTIGQRILAANGITERIAFRVKNNTETVNAYAERFGSVNTVSVYRGLLQHLDSDDELAALLSHEIAHITMRHHRRQIMKVAPVHIAKSLALAALVLYAGHTPDNVESAQRINGATTYIAHAQFSKGHEKESDRVGVDYMVNAGYNPLAMETLMTKITGDAGPFFTTLFSTHPLGTERIQLIRDKIARDYPQFLDDEVATALPGSQYALQAHPEGKVPHKMADKHMAYARANAPGQPDPAPAGWKPV